MEDSRQAITTGVVLMLAGTLCASFADAALKSVASDYAAPQVLLIAALLSIGLTFLANGRGGVRRVVHTGAPRAMAVRAAATVVAAIGFYNAFVLIPFAEVFLFIGAMPLMAAALSGPILGERVSGRVWAVLGIGFVGLICLYPGFLATEGWAGHAYAALGSVAGTLSVVVSRHIGRHDTHSLAQVFFPQLAVALVMALFLPGVLRPMSSGDVALIVCYSILLFSGRWIMVIVARLLPAWLTLQLLNLQFVWMVAIGSLLFGESVGLNVYLGAGLVILAGMILSRQEIVRKVDAVALADADGHHGSALGRGAAMVRFAARAAK